MSAFNTLFDDNFTNAPVSGSRAVSFPTATGAAGSTSGVGNGWVDFGGGYWRLPASGQASIYSSTTFDRPPLNGLYQPATGTILNGRVRAWCAIDGNSAVIARFNPANGGSGYGFSLYANSQLWAFRADAGSTAQLVGGAALSGTIPASPRMIELVVSPGDNGAAQLAFNVYSLADLANPAATYTYTDPNPLPAGYWGLAHFGFANTDTFSRVQIAEVSSALAVGPATLTFAGRTRVAGTVPVPTGGAAPYSYQWQRSGDGGATWANVGGATARALVDATAAAATTYSYRCVVGDSATGTATSASFAATTLAATALIILGIGDSTMSGYGVPSSAVNNPLAVLGRTLGGILGYPTPGIINDAVVGTTTTDWQPGGAYLPTAIAHAQDYGVTDVWLRLGINDSKPSALSQAAYQANLQAIVSAIQSSCPGVVWVWLCYPQFIVPSGQWDSSSPAALVSYQAAVRAVVAANPSVCRLGNTLSYAYFSAHADELIDGVHPGQAGALDLGQQDAVTLYTALALPSPQDVAAAMWAYGHRTLTL